VSILVSLLGLAFLILIHEAGHFFVALAVGMNPRKFYIGFPPAVAKTKRNGIEYGIGAIPLGGYVKIPGMHRPAAGDLDVHFGRAVEEQPLLQRPVDVLRRELEASDYEAAKAALAHTRDTVEAAELSAPAANAAGRGLTEIQDALAPDAYWRARTWKRVAVIFAGPAANLIFAIAIFTAILWSRDAAYRLGFELRATDERVMAIVGDVLEGTPAEEAGLQDGDRIVSIDGRRVTGETIRPTIQGSGGQPLEIVVVRDGRQVDLVPVRAEAAGEYSFVSAVSSSVTETWRVTEAIGATIGRLVTGSGRDEISSPVGIVQGSSEALDQGGTESFLAVLGLISLSLALLNLLPLLPLDGGHIAFSLIEGLRGKAVAREVYERVSVVGIALVLLLFFIGLSNDIGRLGE
jgi:regulator of sigma E protease